MINATIFGKHDDNTLEQLTDVASRAERTALMADGHLGYIMPIGGVAAYHNQVSVAGVGFDIACGNAAINTGVRLEMLCGLNIYELDRDPTKIRNPVLGELADAIRDTFAFGIGGVNQAADAPTDGPLFQESAWNAIPSSHRNALKETARLQLGTIGSGNHYVDVFVAEDNVIWVGVHFGSRRLGHTIASNIMALAQGEPWGTRVKEEEALLDLSTPLGDTYWSLMTLAGKYAYAGREWVARKVTSMLGGTEVRLVHNHHNFAWKEEHMIRGDRLEEVVVVRKGATPAWPGQEGFVGGSMGDDSVILRGAKYAKPDVIHMQRLAMFSTVHGAGRVMSRSAATGAVNRKTGKLKVDTDGKVKREPRVTRSMMDSWLNDKGVLRRGGGVDESPHVYRRLRDVLIEQGDTIEVETRLRPLIAVMAGGGR